MMLFVDDDDPSCGGFVPCYHTIQEAVAAAQAGDMIKVRAGTYRGFIIIDKSLVLSGESKETVLVEGGEPVTYQQPVVTISGSALVEIENLSIHGKLSRTSLLYTTGVAIVGQNPRVTIRRSRLFQHLLAVSLTNEPGGISPSSGQLVITESEISHNWQGVYIITDGSQLQVIQGNLFLDNSLGINASGKGNMTIDRNRVFYEKKQPTAEVGPEAGIWLGGSLTAMLRQNVIQGTLKGIELKDSVQAQLEENQITNNFLNGVIVRDNAHAQLARNQITYNGLITLEFSLFLDPFSLPLVMEFDPKGFGIAIGPNASAEILENKIEGNVIGIGATSSPLLQGPPARLIAQKNQILNNGWGVWVGGGEVIVSDNEINHNGILEVPLSLTALFPAAGILVQNGQPILQLNYFAGNRAGVIVQGPAQPMLSRNRIVSSDRYGISLYLEPCYDIVPIASAIEFKGEVSGEANELSANKAGDLCPPDYPWPPGFRK
jgi:parallel beta-helix repeat protein